MTIPSTARLAEWLHEQTAGFAKTVDGADLAAPVPTCPGWTLRDLASHVGRSQRWGAEMVERGVTDGPLPQDEVDVPEAPGERAAWLLDGAERLVEAVERGDGRTPLWSFLGPRPASFWLRRMLHDTVVHRADAALAVGGPYELEAGLAADAVTEGLELITSPLTASLNPALAELRGDGETLCFLPAEKDLPGWLLTRTPDGLACARSRKAGQVTVRGPVTDLLLVLTRRIGPDDPHVKIAGDRPLLDHWLARTAFG
ncbi:maleylpyruvate isomerase family mycothiol-dependent enzyme [Spirillospora sp. NPDC127200]